MVRLGVPASGKYIFHTLCMHVQHRRHISVGGTGRCGTNIVGLTSKTKHDFRACKSYKEQRGDLLDVIEELVCSQGFWYLQWHFLSHAVNRRKDALTYRKIQEE